MCGEVDLGERGGRKERLGGVQKGGRGNCGWAVIYERRILNE